MRKLHGPVEFVEFVWIWNHLQGLKTPQLHVDITRWLDRSWVEGRRELLLMVFRDAGKSTLVGLFCAWLLYRDAKLRILVLAADLELARKMVRNVKRIIERHPLTKKLKPKRRELWGSEQFTVERDREFRDPSVLAKGVTTNLTGCRADVVICDDVEVPNTCDTASKRQNLRDRLREVEFVMVPGGLQMFVGTPHHYFSLYANDARTEIGETEPFLAGFHRLVLPLLNAQGQSLWPERFTPRKIAAIRRRAGPARFASQMMLEPTQESAGRLDPTRLLPYSDEPEWAEAGGEIVVRLRQQRILSAACCWDPAFAANEGGDRSVVALVFVDENQEYWLHRLLYLKANAQAGDDVASQQVTQVAQLLQEFELPVIRVETNGIGQFLPGLLRKFLAARGIGTSVQPFSSHSNKAKRILDAFDAPLAAGALHIHQSIYQSPFLREMQEWRPDGNGHDDGLDAVALCLTAEPVRFRPHRMASRSDWRPGRQPTLAPTNFSI